MAVAEKKLSQRSLKAIKSAFLVDKLTDHQANAIEGVLNGRDVFVGTKTGSGKSLIFQALPLVFGCDDDAHSHAVVIVEPLISIIKEQVHMLSALGFQVLYGKDATDINSVTNAQYIFLSPETAVGNDEWRKALGETKFVEKLVAIVVDEAHTVLLWGKSKHTGEEAFRKWLGALGELRSICPNVPMIALTATASKINRRRIMKSLCMVSAVELLDSPERVNITLQVFKMKPNLEESMPFTKVLALLRDNPSTCPRLIIFCNSMNACARVNGIFRRELDMTDATSSPFEMWHSHTLQHIKDRITTDMNLSDPAGKIRVLICTDVAGMGVNFKSLHNVLHYGPPRDMDTLVQELGRVGRDEVPSKHLLVFYGRQQKDIDDDMKAYIRNDSKCRREVLTQTYQSSPQFAGVKHLCCDVCAQSCQCGVCDQDSSAVLPSVDECVESAGGTVSSDESNSSSTD